MTESAERHCVSDLSWTEANEEYLALALQRLRLLLTRRILWLRSQWRDDPLQFQNFQGILISDARADWLLRGGNDPIVEDRFYADDAEARRLGKAISEAGERLSARRGEFEKAGVLPALEILARRFGLTAFERDVLLLPLAPELDPAFGKLYAYADDDVTHQYATPHLALALFRPGGTADGAAKDSFLPEAPLFRFRLLRLEKGARPAATPGAGALTLESRVGDYLRGVNRLDEELTDLLRPMHPVPLAPAHRELVTRLRRALESRPGEAPWRVVNLIGPNDAGKGAVAGTLCEDLGLGMLRINPARLPPHGRDRLDLLRLLEREAVLLPAAYYLDADEGDPEDRGLEDARRELMERLGALLIVSSRVRQPTEQALLAVSVPKPDATAQCELWHRAVTPAGDALGGAIADIVQQFDLGPRAIAQAADAARVRSGMREQRKEIRLAADDLWQACRELSRRPLDELAQRLEPCWKWDDIVLPRDTAEQLRELAAQVAQRPRVYGTWGFGARLTRGRGISALFSGPSGTGKTMAAEVLGNRLGLDLYRIDLAGVVSKYIGETEKNLRKVFDAAEASGAILFFDEADALFGKRTEVKDSHDRYANIEIGYLLQRMEDYRGLAVLASNRKSDLDRAFLRRLRFLVDFPFPDSASRRQIWQKVFPPQTELEEIDYEALARLEIPGGNIRNIALNAAFLAADENRPIGMAHLMRAARREYAKIEKIVNESEFGRFYREVRR